MPISTSCSDNFAIPIANEDAFPNTRHRSAAGIPAAADDNRVVDNWVVAGRVADIPGVAFPVAISLEGCQIPADEFPADEFLGDGCPADECRVVESRADEFLADECPVDECPVDECPVDECRDLPEVEPVDHQRRGVACRDDLQLPDDLRATVEFQVTVEFRVPVESTDDFAGSHPLHLHQDETTVGQD
jgi:hypothetical protein